MLFFKTRAQTFFSTLRFGINPWLFALGLCLLVLGVSACNLPIGNSNQGIITQTVSAIQTATGAVNLTLTAQENALEMTQTAGVPTATATASPTSTLPATAAPTSAPTLPPNVTPTQTSVALGALKVGVEAFVRTTQGVPLSLRESAGKTAKLVVAMPGDTRVKITGGPQAADGLLWWQVTVLTSSDSAVINKSGWCVEWDGTVQTLQPAK